MIPLLGPADPFPPVEFALDEPNGLLAAGGTLDVQRLIEAYARGIFPWFSAGDPILWWSPDPRMVLFVDEFHVSRSLARRLRKQAFEVTADRAFTSVLRACAEPRRGDRGTWLVPAMIRAYQRLHEAGVAHSIEVWNGPTLAGGLYGVAIVRGFFGESMFSRQSDGSKIALAYLVAQLARWRYPFIDCQMSTTHLASLGAREIARGEFLRLVHRLVGEDGVPGPWQLDTNLNATWA
jgi:leucyl/phenylalanyl-tRNA--protein transferase